MKFRCSAVSIHYRRTRMNIYHHVRLESAGVLRLRGKKTDMHKKSMFVLLAMLLALAAASQMQESLLAQTPQKTAPSTVTIPSGTRIVVRLDNELSSKTSEEETVFTGSVARPVVVGTTTVIPLGTPAKGLIEEAEPAGKRPSGAELQLRLTSVTLEGRLYPMRTASVSPSSKGKSRAANAVSAGNADITLPAGSTVSFRLLMPLKIAVQP